VNIPATVAVSASTVWRTPDAPRQVDQPVVADQPDHAGWVAALDRASRLGLHGRVETQLLFGEPVVILDERGPWSEMVAPWQPSGTDKRGYRGWVRTAHLQPGRPETPAGAETAVVMAPTAVLTHPGGAYTVSWATRLPVRRRSADLIVVDAPRLGETRLAPGDAVIESPRTGPEATTGTAPNATTGAAPDASPCTGPDATTPTPPEGTTGGVPHATTATPPDATTATPPNATTPERSPGTAPNATTEAVVDVARRLIGLRYLWGGLTGWGLDCSGLVHGAYRSVGVTVPRDAEDQHRAVERVPLGEVRVGDLYFFAGDGDHITHVGFATSSASDPVRTMLHAPGNSARIVDEPLTADRMSALVEAGRVAMQTTDRMRPARS
jgi:cell wall-associated NlpC family hydrolase